MINVVFISIGKEILRYHSRILNPSLDKQVPVGTTMRPGSGGVGAEESVVSGINGPHETWC